MGTATLEAPAVRAPAIRRRRRDGGLQAWLFALPALAVYVVFLVYPALTSVWFSFTDWDGLSPTASGTSHSEYDGDAVPAVGEREVIALHATCPLSQLPDPDLPVQSVRLLWQMLADGPTGSARYESQSENETGGLDFTVMWVLQPTS